MLPWGLLLWMLIYRVETWHTVNNWWSSATEGKNRTWCDQLWPQYHIIFKFSSTISSIILVMVLILARLSWILVEWSTWHWIKYILKWRQTSPFILLIFSESLSENDIAMAAITDYFQISYSKHLHYIFR